MKRYTVKETAAILGVSAPTVYRYIGDGDLIPLKVGGRIFVEQRSIDDFLAKSNPSLVEDPKLQREPVFDAAPMAAISQLPTGDSSLGEISRSIEKGYVDHFVRQFVAESPLLIHPTTEESLSGVNWGGLKYEQDGVEALMRLLRVKILDLHQRESFPHGVQVRFFLPPLSLKKQEGSWKPRVKQYPVDGLVIEMRMVIQMEDYVSGRFEKPKTVRHLQQALELLGRELDQGSKEWECKIACLVGFASLSGWHDECVQFIDEYSDPYMIPVLVDLYQLVTYTTPLGRAFVSLFDDPLSSVDKMSALLRSKTSDTDDQSLRNTQKDLRVFAQKG
ncbi:MAG: helix-turn-helix domain-containing protein [Bdellovibrionales bacterium]|nr:helix-turn-helix domain-containing protein [Bdellovibrionales bacterium]